MKCGHCSREIKSNSCAPLYRTCDSYVCSPRCSVERFKVITKLDPKLTYCMLWADTTTIVPPKSFERKESCVKIGSLLDGADRISNTTPILNNNNNIVAENNSPVIGAENDSPVYVAENDSHVIGAENDSITTDNSLGNISNRSILCMTMETLAIVCVSTITVGMIILIG